MNRVLTLGLLATLGLGLITACDYENGPGIEPQFSQDFTNGPRATAADTDLDSVSQSQNAYTPIGKGSAADQRTSVNGAMRAKSAVSSIPKANPEAKATTREN